MVCSRAEDGRANAARETTVRRLGLNLTDSVLASPLPATCCARLQGGREGGRERASGEGVEAYRVPRASTIISPLRAPAYPDPCARPRRRRGVFIIFTRRYRYPIEPILIPRRESPSFPFFLVFCLPLSLPTKRNF